jgi:hypothetical protein
LEFEPSALRCLIFGLTRFLRKTIGIEALVGLSLAAGEAHITFTLA